jgi:hypothetical protein
MKIIKSVKEINSTGQYRFAWLETVIIIDVDYDKKDNPFYCISVGNNLIMSGWQVKAWRTIKGVQSAIEQIMIDRLYGLSPEPHKMTLEELKKLAVKRGIKL